MCHNIDAALQTSLDETNTGASLAPDVLLLHTPTKCSKPSAVSVHLCGPTPRLPPADSPVCPGVHPAAAAAPALEASAVAALGAPPLSARHPLAGGAGPQLLALHQPPAALHQHVIPGASVVVIAVILRIVLLRERMGWWEEGRVSSSFAQELAASAAVSNELRSAKSSGNT